MNYGTVKVDTVIYTSAGLDASVSISGLANGVFSNLATTGTISGSTGIFTVLSGTTITGTTTNFTSGTFTVLSGTTVTGTTANFTSGVFATSQLTDPAIVGTIKEDIYTITDGAAFEIDPGNGSIQLITLGASRTPKATNFAAGETVILMVDDGSAYTITWSDTTFGASGVLWKTNGGVAPTLNTTGYTVIVLWEVGTQIYGARVGDA
jgi:hypothetical protein